MSSLYRSAVPLLQATQICEGVTMKIVGFEANGAPHLGVVEGDQVIDLQAVDAGIPGDLSEVRPRMKMVGNFGMLSRCEPSLTCSR